MILDNSTPTRYWRLCAYSKKTQSTFDKNGTGKIGCRYNNNWSHTIGQNVFYDYSEIAETQSSSGSYILHLFYAHNLASNHSCNLYPHRKTYRDKHQPKSFSQSQSNSYHQKQRGNRPSNVYKPHYGGINLSSKISSNRP